MTEKSEEQLASELEAAKQKIARLEALEAEWSQAEEEARRRAAQAALLYDIGQRVSSELELDELLSAIVTVIYDAFHYYSVALLLLDDDKKHIESQAVIGEYEGTYPEKLNMEPGEGMIGRAASTGETQVSGDVDTNPHYVRKQLMQTRSELAVPIRSGQAMIGVLDIQSDRLHAFDEIDVATMEALSTQIGTAIKNARLFEAARVRAQRLALVNRIAKVAGATLSLEDLMAAVHEEVAPAFQADAFFIALYEEETEMVDLAYLIDAGVRQPRQRLPLGLGVTSMVIAEKQPVAIRNPEERAPYEAARQLFGTMEPPDSWLGVPMLVGDRVVGVISVQAYRSNAWDAEDEMLLFTIADQVAVALENARLFEELQWRARQLSLINDIGSKIAAVLELDTVLDRAASLVQQSFRYHHVGLFTLDRDRDELVMRAKAGDFAHLFPAGHHLKLNQGIVGWVGYHGRRLLANDVKAEPRYVNLYPDVIPTRSELGVPIGVGGEVIGVLDVQSPQLNAFTEGDIVLIETLADQIAVAIENARLYEAVEQELAERRRADQALRDSELRFRSIAETASDAVIIFDSHYTIFYWNHAARVVFGYSPGETRYKLLSSIIAGQFYQHLQAEIERVTSTGESDLIGRAVEVTGVRKDGTSFPLELSLAAWKTQGEVFFTVIARDVTARKQAEEALKEYSERLEEMVEERTRELQEAQAQLLRREKLAVLGQMAGSVGHDLRNPLGAIKNAVYFLNMAVESPDPDIQETLEIMEGEIDTAENIIGSLLDFARTKPPKRQLVDVNRLIRDTVSRIDVPDGVDVVIDLDEALPPTMVDPGQMVQVFRNLIVNGIQAMADGGRLVLESTKTDSGMVFSISDSGVGISEEHLKRLFEPLFTTKARGIGLGLAIVRTLVEGHGGVVKVESELGRGSTFTVWLPIVDGESYEKAEEGRGSHPDRRRRSEARVDDH